MPGCPEDEIEIRKYDPDYVDVKTGLPFNPSANVRYEDLD